MLPRLALFASCLPLALAGCPSSPSVHVGATEPTASSVTSPEPAAKPGGTVSAASTTAPSAQPSGTVQSAAPSARGPLQVPPASSPEADPTAQQAAMSEYLNALHAAGDSRQCDAAVTKIRRELAEDRRFSDSALARERAARDTKDKGPMPYPSPGTACAIFGIVTALQGALDDRRSARAAMPNNR